MTSAVRSTLTVALCFVLCAARGLQMWSQLRLGGFDLGIFDQAIRAYAHFHAPVSSIKNVHHNFPPTYSLLGDHFSPILALLAPLYWLWNEPRMLLLAQAALFAAGVPLVRRLARITVGDALAGNRRERVVDVAGVVYATGWPFMSAASAGFHEVAFAVPFALLLLLAASERRYRLAGLAALGLCLTKEDLGLIVGVFGLVLLIRSLRAGDRPGRTTGLLLFVLGPLASVLEIDVLIPALGGVRGYYWDYDLLGSGPVGVVHNLVTRPWVLVTAAADHRVKLQLVGWVVGSLALLPLSSLTTLCWLPLLAERIYSANTNHWTVTNQYDAFIWPFLLVAAIETYARLLHRAPRGPTYAVGGVAVVTALLTSSALGLVGKLLWADRQPGPSERGMLAAARLIPPGASVEANNDIAPRLTADHYVVIADETPHCLDYVLLRARRQLDFGFLSDTAQLQRARLLEQHGYALVSDQDGAALLRRTAAADVPGCMMPGPGSTPVREVVPPGQVLPLFSGAFVG